VGAWVLALGNTNASGPWVTTGVVASMGGWADDGSGVAKAGLITTSAPMPNGARGGALVDRSGRVVGILAGSPGGIDGGLATPVSVLRTVADQLANTGRASHGSLGVSASDTTSPRGARVTQVFGGTGAAAAGIKVGDVIVRLDGAAIPDTAALVAAIRGRKPDDRVSLVVARARRHLEVTASLGATDSPAQPAGSGLATPVALG
jgi:S1-C subfamily serine protease